MDKNMRIARELVRIAKEMLAANDNAGTLKMPDEPKMPGEPKGPFNLVIDNNPNNPENELAKKAQDWLAKKEIDVVCGEDGTKMMLLFKTDTRDGCGKFRDKVMAGMNELVEKGDDIEEKRKYLAETENGQYLVEKGIVDKDGNKKYKCLNWISCYTLDGKNKFHLNESRML